jgi:hypothetical protein
MPTHRKKQSSNKSPMKTGLLSHIVPAPHSETFNFLDEKEDLDVGEVSPGHESPKLKVWKKPEKKL